MACHTDFNQFIFHLISKMHIRCFKTLHKKNVLCGRANLQKSVNYTDQQRGARMHHGIRMTGLICHYNLSLQDMHWQNITSYENVCGYAGCLGSRLAFTGAGVDPTTLCTLTVFLYSINYLLQVETRPLILHFIHLLCSSLFLFIHSPNESALFRCVNHLKVLRLQGFWRLNF